MDPEVLGRILECRGGCGMDPGVPGWILGCWGGCGMDPGCGSLTFLPSRCRIASSNNMNKSESDQEDNDDINDNDWSYGSEKKGGGTRGARCQPGQGAPGPP